MKALILLSVLMIAGCASNASLTAQIPVPVACKAAQERIDLPHEKLNLAGLDAGAVVLAYAENRTAWIGAAKTLAVKLESCK